MSPRACSGLMYDGVPIVVPCSVWPDDAERTTDRIGLELLRRRRGGKTSLLPITLASPQSTTRVSP